MYHSKRPLSDDEEGLLNVIANDVEWVDLAWGEQTLLVTVEGEE